MRSVKEQKRPARKAASRRSATGSRSASGRGAKTTGRTSTVAPGRRRAKSGKSFGRRGQRPPSRLSRTIEAIREGRLPKSLVGVASAGFVGAAALYGLAVGGHIAAAGSYVADQATASVAWVGFGVDEVTVAGRERTTRADVLKALEVEQGQVIFTVDLESARENLMRLDWIADATVTRILPDRVHVELVERRPFAVWQRGGRLAVIDAQGRPITEDGVEGYGHLPLVVGHGAAREAEGFTQVVAAWPELQARVRAYVRVGDRRWNLRLENGVDVLLPEVGVSEALAELVAIDEAQRVLARDIEAIDVRLPDRFTVRLSPDAAARRDAVVQGWGRPLQGDDT
ncbi:MAG: cell division protein FtsQ [Parvibaculum sp.]|nr:cell division protein FtsQ [Parvibaculum sp.]